MVKFSPPFLLYDLVIQLDFRLVLLEDWVWQDWLDFNRVHSNVVANYYYYSCGSMDGMCDCMREVATNPCAMSNMYTWASHIHVKYLGYKVLLPFTFGVRYIRVPLYMSRQLPNVALCILYLTGYCAHFQHHILRSENWVRTIVVYHAKIGILASKRGVRIIPRCALYPVKYGILLTGDLIIIKYCQTRL